ncbi:MAG: metal ABC transporter permease [Bacteroidales bacterium]|jgi:zinc transport system permease protein|nr:metal ABC transporter permease [Bacteroidales bacterium]NLM93797.1 metal ABC transporter permease [Bacteroidales bacterium]
MSEVFSILEYAFFRNALAAALLTSILSAMVGTYIVSRKIVFISGGITHASFGGIGMAYYFGLNPLLGAAVFAILSATGIEWVSQKGKVREDSAIAILWSLGMALGIIFVFMTPGYTPNLMSFLFGSILSVGKTELYLLLAFSVVVALFFRLYLRPVVYSAFDPEFSKIMGLPVGFFRYTMSVIIALAIVISIRSVGIILVLSLFTIPQITAMLFTRNFANIIPLSALWGVTGSLAGLFVSYFFNIPSGAAIIFFLTLQFFVVKAIVVLLEKIRRRAD